MKINDETIITIEEYCDITNTSINLIIEYINKTFDASKANNIVDNGLRADDLAEIFTNWKVPGIRIFLDYYLQEPVCWLCGNKEFREVGVSQPLMKVAIIIECINCEYSILVPKQLGIKEETDFEYATMVFTDHTKKLKEKENNENK